ncbi:hypothetical protein BDR05DRAFT_1056147 [Suillus weaverae]|nr:hypothetical protein BDR05DRAFT_1056147 [Suillus weaverae]
MKSGRLVGRVLGAIKLENSLFLLRRLLGVRTEDRKQTKVSEHAKNELLLINIGSTSSMEREADLAKIQLTSPTIIGNIS